MPSQFRLLNKPITRSLSSSHLKYQLSDNLPVCSNGSGSTASNDRSANQYRDELIGIGAKSWSGGSLVWWSSVESVTTDGGGWNWLRLSTEAAASDARAWRSPSCTKPVRVRNQTTFSHWGATSLIFWSSSFECRARTCQNIPRACFETKLFAYKTLKFELTPTLSLSEN